MRLRSPSPHPRESNTCSQGGGTELRPRVAEIRRCARRSPPAATLRQKGVRWSQSDRVTPFWRAVVVAPVSVVSSRGGDPITAAYTSVRPLRAGAGERLQAYAVADALFMWNVSSRITQWFAGATFVEVARPAVDNARAAAAD